MYVSDRGSRFPSNGTSPAPADHAPAYAAPPQRRLIYINRGLGAALRMIFSKWSRQNG
jgi:hypothetical protein